MPTITTPRFNTEDMPSVLRELRQTLTSGVQALNSALVEGDTLQVYQPFTAASPLVVPDCWTAFTYVNSFADFGGGQEPGAYRKDAGGVVWLRGNASTGNYGATITTLPTGFRPAYVVQRAAMANNLYAYLNITTGGALSILQTGTAGAVPFSSVACSFLCADASPYVPSCFPITAGVWPFSYAPTLVLAQAQDATNQASPINTALSLADWTVSTQSNQQVLTVRNIPGLPPSRNYSVTVVAF